MYMATHDRQVTVVTPYFFQTKDMAIVRHGVAKIGKKWSKTY